MKNRIIIFLMLLAGQLSKAQTGLVDPGFNTADSLISAFMNKWNIPGGAVTIAREGQLIYSRGFGYTDAGRTQRATPNTLFRIASVSKPITALAIMKLVQEGRLSLNQKVFGDQQIIARDYYLGRVSDPRVFDISVQHLLEHTSGWDRAFREPGFSHNDPPFFPLHVSEVEQEQGPVGDSTLIRFSLARGLQHTPGTVFAYSNIGYLILGKVIEQISGQSYYDYVDQHLLKPLGIADMRLGKNLPELKHERESEYFGRSSTLSCYGDGALVPSQYGGFNLEAMNAHGGWIASAADLSRLLQHLYTPGNSDVLFDMSTLELMSEPGEINPHYAKGWAVNAKKSMWHTGSIEGSASFVARTADGTSWSFLFNSRADNSEQFWKEFDRLPWNCLKSIDEQHEPRNLFAPTVNVTALYATAIVNGSALLRWNSGSGNGRIVIASEDTLNPVHPEDGIIYAADDFYGQGETLGNRTFVVYQGKNNQALVSGLDPDKTYFITAYEYKLDETTSNLPVYRLAGRARIKLRALQPAI